MQDVCGFYFHSQRAISTFCKRSCFFHCFCNDFFWNIYAKICKFHLAVMLRQCKGLLANWCSGRKFQCFSFGSIGNKISQMTENLKCIYRRRENRHSDLDEFFLVFRVSGVFCKRYHGNRFAVLAFFPYNFFNSLIHIVNRRICHFKKQSIADQYHLNIWIIHDCTQCFCIQICIVGKTGCHIQRIIRRCIGWKLFFQFCKSFRCKIRIFDSVKTSYIRTDSGLASGKVHGCKNSLLRITIQCGKHQ